MATHNAISTSTKCDDTITLGYVTIQRAVEESAGETRKRLSQFARVVPITVRSGYNPTRVIVPVNEISLAGGWEMVGITSTPDLASSPNIALPAQERGFEFSFERLPVLALIQRDNKLLLANLGIGSAIDLPPNTSVVGLISLPVGTISLSAYDPKTDTEFQLGYSFPQTTQPDWLAIATERRDARLAQLAQEKRAREHEKAAEAERESRESERANSRESVLDTPVPMFETNDKWVKHFLLQTYADNHQLVRSTQRVDAKGETVYVIEDPSGLGESVEEYVLSRRDEFVATDREPDVAFAQETDAKYESSLVSATR